MSSAGGGTPPCPEHRSLTFFVRSAALAPSILSTWDLFCSPRNTLVFSHQWQCHHYHYEQGFKCLATFGNCIHLPHLKNMTLCHWISMISKDINRFFKLIDYEKIGFKNLSKQKYGILKPYLDEYKCGYCCYFVFLRDFWYILSFQLSK